MPIVQSRKIASPLRRLGVEHDEEKKHPRIKWAIPTHRKQRYHRSPFAVRRTFRFVIFARWFFFAFTLSLCSVNFCASRFLNEFSRRKNVLPYVRFVLVPCSRHRFKHRESTEWHLVCHFMCVCDSCTCVCVCVFVSDVWRWRPCAYNKKSLLRKWMYVWILRRCQNGRSETNGMRTSKIESRFPLTKLTTDCSCWQHNRLQHQPNGNVKPSMPCRKQQQEQK